MKLITQDKFESVMKNGQDDYDEVLFESIHITNQNLNAVWFDNCKFIDVIIDNSTLANSRFMNCEFKQVTFLVKKWIMYILKNVVLKSVVF